MAVCTGCQYLMRDGWTYWCYLDGSDVYFIERCNHPEVAGAFR